jgi:hypothetical protein
VLFEIVTVPSEFKVIGVALCVEPKYFQIYHCHPAVFVAAISTVPVLKLDCVENVLSV